MPATMLSGGGGTVGSGGGGRTAYGSVPGPIGIPPNIFSQLSGAVPGFGLNTSGTSNVIASELAGTVSPMTLNALKTGAAQFGINSGMGPGSGLETNQLFGNIAGFSEGLQEKGVRNYLSEVGALGPTMTNPNLAAEIAARNADLEAAPDPKLAAEQAFKDWLRGFEFTRSAGSPAGPWAPGGTLGPTHSNWGGYGLTPPTDALGFPSYNMSPEWQGTITATATPPPGGWGGEAAQPWNAGFVTSPPNPYFYTGEEPPTNPGPDIYG